MLLSDVWVNPVVQPTTPEETKALLFYKLYRPTTGLYIAKKKLPVHSSFFSVS